MARNYPEFRLRIPEKLKAEIEAEAKKNQRSINSEIISRLNKSFSSESHDQTSLVEEMQRLRDMVSDIMIHVGLAEGQVRISGGRKR